MITKKDVFYAISWAFFITIILLFTGVIVSAMIPDNRMQLEQDVNELISKTQSWYKYNVTADNLLLTDDDLRLRGGDCKDWSEYYARHLSQYDTQFIIVPVKEHMNHEYLSVSNIDGFCIISLQEYTCWRYNI